jgi:hypothetical protein
MSVLGSSLLAIWDASDGALAPFLDEASSPKPRGGPDADATLQDAFRALDAAASRPDTLELLMTALYDTV